MEIRKTSALDRSPVKSVHRQAFGGQKGAEIAALVDGLLDDETAAPRLSLVAVDNGEIVGHVLFTNARIARTDASVAVRILGPLAVLPEFQKRGVGKKLINEGLKQLKRSGVDIVFVLGHPDYYPRAGFEPAGALGFEAPYAIPEMYAGAWMVQELRAGVLGRVAGTVQCCEVFDRPEHWRE